MSSRIYIWICEPVDTDGEERSDEELANFCFGQPLKGLVARKWFDHDGSLGGDLDWVRVDQLLQLVEQAKPRAIGPIDEYEYNRLIDILNKMKPEATVKIAIIA
jgi:hypothetical protein